MFSKIYAFYHLMQISILEGGILALTHYAYYRLLDICVCIY